MTISSVLNVAQAYSVIPHQTSASAESKSNDGIQLNELGGSEHDVESLAPRSSLLSVANTSSLSLDAHLLFEAEEQELQSCLQLLEFASPSPAQKTLEQEYVFVTAHALAVRKAELGGGYMLASEMQTSMNVGVWAACYEASSGAVSSAARSPVRNAVGVGLNGTAELNLPLSQASLSGAIGGVTAYMAAEWVLKAADRKAKKYNFTEIVKINLEKALPYPCAIELTVSGATKTYQRRNARQLASAMAVIDTERAALTAAQTRLSGNGELSPYAQGLITGALNVLRRLGPATALLDPGTVFGTSLAASAAGGFLTRGAFGLLKLSYLAQTEVDDLVGGQQKINLFRVKKRNSDVDESASWTDVRRFAGETLYEAGALGLHRLNCADTPWCGQAKDIVSHALINAIASVGSTAIGGLIATGIRGPLQIGPAAGEAHNSPGYLMQQFFQSAVNDYMWNAGKKLTGSPVSNLSESLDLQRANAPQAVLTQEPGSDELI